MAEVSPAGEWEEGEEGVGRQVFSLESGKIVAIWIGIKKKEEEKDYHPLFQETHQASPCFTIFALNCLPTSSGNLRARFRL